MPLALTSTPPTNTLSVPGPLIVSVLLAVVVGRMCGVVGLLKTRGGEEGEEEEVICM
jgi:hypothetical protein